jgi:hypothetical protein
MRLGDLSNREGDSDCISIECLLYEYVGACEFEAFELEFLVRRQIRGIVSQFIEEHEV